MINMASSRSRRINRPRRVFIDSSVLIAGAISGSGNARELLLLGARGMVELVVSVDVLTETKRNLNRKVPHAVSSFELLRDTLFPSIVHPDSELVREVAAHVAAKDAPIVAAAILAQVEFLATYDQRHLIREAAEIQARFGLVVTTPDQIIALGADDEDQPT